MTFPDRRGRFGAYGGRYVPETLIPALDELTAAWDTAKEDATFWDEVDEPGRTYAGRPTPLTRADRFAPAKRLYLKREDLLHTGAHKLNHCMGEGLLAKYMRLVSTASKGAITDSIE